MKTVYKPYVMTIGNGEVIPVAVYGRFLAVLESSSTSDLEFSIGNQEFVKIPKGISVDLAVGDDADSGYFTDIIIRNTTGASVTITFAISAGHIFDSRVVLSGSLSVNATPDTLTSPAAAAVTDSAAVAVAADSTTRQIVMQNNGSNAIWIGDANVDVTTKRGYKIESGSGLIMETAGAVYAVCDTGLTSTLSIVRSSKV